MKHVGYAFATALSALYFLLAVQAEPVTQTLGYIAGGLLAVSVISAIVKGR